MSDYGVDPLVYDGVLYDAQNSFPDDLPFYSRQCAAAGGREILELCCGTGRLTIPLAREGHRITGLDFTPRMLQLARTKAEAAGVKIEWVQGDMRDFSLGKRFGLIFIPFNSIQNTYTLEDVERILQRVHEHLESDGTFILDIFNPSIDLMVSLRQTPNRSSFLLPDGRRVDIEESCAYDSAAQVNRVTWIYHLPGQSEPVRQRLDMRCFYPLEMDGVLKYNGWKIAHKFGSFCEEPFSSQSMKQIFVCHR